MREIECTSLEELVDHITNYIRKNNDFNFMHYMDKLAGSRLEIIDINASDKVKFTIHQANIEYLNDSFVGYIFLTHRFKDTFRIINEHRHSVSELEFQDCKLCMIERIMKT